MRVGEAALCADCAVDTCPCDERRGCRHKGRWEWYMVTDDLWAAAGIEPHGGFLCVGCLESRICRQLAPADFTDYPINEPNPWDTPRLASRKGDDTCPVDRLDTAKVLHHGSRSDIDYGIANNTPVTALCGAQRRAVLPRPAWPVCAECARIVAGKR